MPRATSITRDGPFRPVREVLQVQLQIAQVEGELGKALAGLERAVGQQISELPRDIERGPSSLDKPSATTKPPTPPGESSPFRAGQSTTFP